MPQYDRLPPLVERDGRLVDVLLSGMIVADPAVQTGEPCLAETRIPVTTLHGHLAAGDGVGLVARSYRVEPYAIQICESFQAGVEWQRSRTRRRRMDEIVDAYWEEVDARRSTNNDNPAPVS